MITANRYHDISCGHRVFGHESKCAHLHGHNYRFHFEVVCEFDRLDSIGRVFDFSNIKSILCEWLENNWDHRFLIWEDDPLAIHLKNIDDTIVFVPFNPTAEKIAEYFCIIVAPAILTGTSIALKRLILEETRKCSVTYEVQDPEFLHFSYREHKTETNYDDIPF